MGEIDKDGRQIDLIDYIEDAEHAGPPALDKSISNEELEDAGLIAVRAFVRSKASKNAERLRKSKEKRENGEAGPARKQLNLQAPIDDEARDVLRELSAAMLDEALTPADIRGLMTKEATNWKERAIAAERERDELRRKLAEASKAAPQERKPIWPLSLLFKR